MVSMLDRKHNGGHDGVPPGQVRVLVVGDTGVGKSSLVHLIVRGSPSFNSRQTVGCTVEVKHLTCEDIVSSSNNMLSGKERDYFVELWDVSGHVRYKDCRSLFYSQINGIIFVHDLSQKKTKVNLQKWATEISICGTFSAPLSDGWIAGIPVPFLIIGNKADLSPKLGGSSGNLVDVARHWVEKQGLLPNMDELPVTERFPGSGGLVASATEGRLDMQAIEKFFQNLIMRRYFGEENTKAHGPAGTRSSTYHSMNNFLHEDASTSSCESRDSEKDGDLVPAQKNLLQPFSYSQHPSLSREKHRAARTPSLL